MNHTVSFDDVAYVINDDFNGIIKITREKDNHVLFLSSLSVKENYRRLGIATELLNECENIARQEGYRCISLEVELSDQTKWLKKWYERKGYTCVGYGYYDNRILMSKILDYNPNCGSLPV